MRREFYRELNRKQFEDPIKREYHRRRSTEANPARSKIWITRFNENKRIDREQLKIYTDVGWTKGRYISQEQKTVMAKNRKTIKDPITGRFIKHEN